MARCLLNATGACCHNRMNPQSLPRSKGSWRPMRGCGPIWRPNISTNGRSFTATRWWGLYRLPGRGQAGRQTVRLWALPHPAGGADRLAGVRQVALAGTVWQLLTADFPACRASSRGSCWFRSGQSSRLKLDLIPATIEFVGDKPQLPPDLYPALIDTGASGNCVDDQLGISLGLPVIHYGGEIFGSAGKHTVTIYLAQIHIADLGRTISGQFAGIHLAAGGQLYRAIIGRSFLSDFMLLYDGRTGAVTLNDDLSVCRRRSC